MKENIKNFRLPTKEEFDKLAECYMRFDEEKQGRWFLDPETKEAFFLPEGEEGYYWSSSLCERNWKNAYMLYFCSYEIYVMGMERTENAYIRLVSDEPFEGSAHVAGIYWKMENEEGEFSFDDAMNKLHLKIELDIFRLPTQDDFERLCKCYTKYDEERNGRWFFDKGTGEELFLTVGNDGYHSCNYWSSTYDNKWCVYHLNVGRNYADPTHNISYDNHIKVRLVSDKPFDGAIYVAGLYWKPENEEGYYTWDEAMEKFNNKNK